ncbi:hypothetical protein [Bacillus pseudomycoides]|uniref:hypothetical protein n=1 Tax=Bacillus pseudomycoides TaxID=64104 RepID=UPI0020D20BE4|nr:hypothetical protein [Bacillus pseudomycoides]
MAKPTINKRIASLKVYWSYLIEQRIAIYDPTKKIKIKRISRLEDTPRWLNDMEQVKLLNLIRREENEWKRKRNMAMVRLMLQAGLRISEVVNLEIGVTIHAHQLKNENKMNSCSYKRNTSKIFGALKKKHTK